ncbi:phosphoribosyltransferase family protein [Streptomyces cinereospinus]|uniref:Phosphoribosyltransferase family protein n=1 Tax=Streptomyces cinereospinus TaxID=285561 RepID=A0ABV5N0Q6_9ACTN
MAVHTIRIGHLQRHLPVVPVGDEVSIAFLKLYGDIELLEVATAALADRLTDDAEVIVGPESGGILLAHLLAQRARRSCVVARKKVRPNMTAPIRVPVRTIGTAGEQELVLGEDDAALIDGRRVALIDEVVSSGGTLHALQALIDAAGGQVVQTLAVATEGERRPSVTSLVHLPVFTRASADGAAG